VLMVSDFSLSIGFLELVRLASSVSSLGLLSYFVRALLSDLSCSGFIALSGFSRPSGQRFPADHSRTLRAFFSTLPLDFIVSHVLFLGVHLSYVRLDCVKDLFFFGLGMRIAGQAKFFVLRG